MAQQLVSNVGEHPAVEVKGVTGDVNIEGWDRSDLEVRGDNPRVERTADALAITGVGDIQVLMPRNGSLRIASLVGDLELRDLAGEVEIAGLVGELTLTNVTGTLSSRGATFEASGQHDPGRVPAEDEVRRHDARATRIEGAVSQAVRRAMAGSHRAEEKIQAAERKVQRVLGKRASITAGWKRRGVVTEQGIEPKNQPATEEERLAILNMLQSRRVTAAQADLLLAALDGETAQATKDEMHSVKDGSG